MAEEFAFRDLSDAVFWGVNLERATFRDVDLAGTRFSHTRLADVVIDAEIDRLVINGVDVTTCVNERDEWFALRSQTRPTEPSSMNEGWTAISTAWAAAIERADGLAEGQCDVSVDDEWSFIEDHPSPRVCDRQMVHGADPRRSLSPDRSPELRIG